MGSAPGSRWFEATRWLLAVSYGLGAPVTAVAEFQNLALSLRFGLPPELIYVTCLVQLASVPALFVHSLAQWAAVALTITTFGAIGAHLSVESPLTAIPALLFTAVQLWFGLGARRASLAV